MPTYEYVCESCGYRFEAFQNMSDSPLTTCPQCGGRIKRLISGGTGLIFKGAGFYETDYKHKKAKEAKKEEPKKKENKAA